MTALIACPGTVERQRYAIDFVTPAVANAALDNTAIVIGLFELQDLSDGHHSLAFRAFGAGELKALGIAGSSRAVAEIEEELGHTRTSGGLEGISSDEAEKP